MASNLGVTKTRLTGFFVSYIRDMNVDDKTVVVEFIPTEESIKNGFIDKLDVFRFHVLKEYVCFYPVGRKVNIDITLLDETNK